MLSRPQGPAVPTIPRRSLLRFAPSLLLAALLAACASPREQTPAPLHLVILHTNDVHGQVLPRKATWIDREHPPLIGGLPRLAARIQSVRASEPNVVVVDAGDWCQGTPEGAIERGLPFASALAGVGYDALCVGNHELDRGLASLLGVIRDTRLPAIAANVSNADGTPLEGVAPWRIVRRGGVRIALVGLLTPSTPQITHADARALRFEAPELALDRARGRLAGEVDLIVPVCHLSVDESQALARARPDLALIVSGHSHTTLKEGLREGGTLIVQTGARATALGRVDLWLDPRNCAVLRSEARLEELLDEPAPLSRNTAVEKICGALVERASADANRPVGELAAPALRRLEDGSSSAGNWICDAMRRHTGAEIALHNRGGTRSDLAAGRVTRRDLFEFLPFDNDLATLTLSGGELEACLRKSIESGAHSGFDFSGMTVHARRSDGKLALTRIEIGGAPLDPARAYRVTTNSFLAGGGDGFDALARGTERRGDPILLRELMEEELQVAGRATPPSDARWAIEESGKP
jgi:2',3'-cyclic-nucleotide 2'-phosphodiesterase (5'-nucleotidase family)